MEKILSIYEDTTSLMFFCFINFSITPCKNMLDSNLIWKKVENIKFKYSPQKKNLNKYNQVFVKEYKFGLLFFQWFV
jgi:hypothetical protein